MHTPIKFYMVIPVNLFRAGTPSKPKFDYLRTLPPRHDDEVYDVKIDDSTKLIDHKSGGLSLFDSPNYNFGRDWWVIPKGAKLPHGFTISKDETDGKFRGHYTIRSVQDIHINEWKRKLKSWAEENAIHINEYICTKGSKNV